MGKACSNGLGHITNMATIHRHGGYVCYMPIHGKKFKNLLDR